MLLGSRAVNHQSRQHSDGAAAKHAPLSASVSVVAHSRDHGHHVSVNHGHVDHGQHVAHHTACVPGHHRASWAETPPHAVSAYDPYGHHREHAHSRIMVSESASARHPSEAYAPHPVPFMVDRGSHSGYHPGFSSTVGYPTQQTHHAHALQSPAGYALDPKGGIAHDIPDIPDMRFPSPMKSRLLMHADPSMASRGRLHHSHEVIGTSNLCLNRRSTSHLRPIHNSLGWELWVLKLTAKERNQVINAYNLTDAEATHLKKMARRTKPRYQAVRLPEAVRAPETQAQQSQQGQPASDRNAHYENQIGYGRRSRGWQGLRPRRQRCHHAGQRHQGYTCQRFSRRYRVLQVRVQRQQRRRRSDGALSCRLIQL